MLRPRVVFAALSFGFGASFSVSVAACHGGSEGRPSDGEPDAALEDAQSGEGAAPRRPARRYYMTRTAKRCEVYSVEGDVISTPVAAPCPASIEVGERIRLSGRSCFREGAPQREQPVVCPGDLMFTEQREREAEDLRRAAESDGGPGDGGAADGGGALTDGGKTKGSGGRSY